MSCRWRARCGRYDERGLSDCAAQWMIREAGKFGFKFESHLTREVEPDPEDAQGARKITGFCK
jgi:hypothetical protein